MKIAEGAALMTETRLEADMGHGGYHKIPNRVLSEIVTANMRAVGAPVYSKEDLEFAAKIAETITKEDRINGLKKNKVPDWEKVVDKDIDTTIYDAWNDGTTSPGSTDVADVSWITPTMEFGTACNLNGAPGHSWQFTACSGTSIGHKSLIFAAKTMAGSVLDLLQNPDKLKEAREEQLSRLRGKTYQKDPTVEPPLERARELSKFYTGKS
jgi:aminobenzoyl-glutamate utilization protein B